MLCKLGDLRRSETGCSDGQQEILGGMGGYTGNFTVGHFDVNDDDEQPSDAPA